LLVRLGELVERTHQGLGHEPTAEGAEPAERVGPRERAIEANSRGIRVGRVGCGRRGHWQAILRRLRRRSSGFIAVFAISGTNGPFSRFSRARKDSVK